MPIISDCHLHSSFSGDSDTPMEEMILQGISQGLTTLCFTEHNDYEFPDGPEEAGSIFLLNVDSYLYDLANYKEKYKDKIRLLFGVELGLQPEVVRQNAVFAKTHEFDFIIGSSHICHRKDPYYKEFFHGRSTEDALREYFESIVENIRKFSNFDVYGHLDYAIRYASSPCEDFSYAQYSDILDVILQLLIEKGKGIELNTGGIQNDSCDFQPYQSILKRFRELGGEILTIGSDAHRAAAMGAHFKKAAEILEECGFRYYCIFEKRSPEFHKL